MDSKKKPFFLKDIFLIPLLFILVIGVLIFSIFLISKYLNVSKFFNSEKKEAAKKIPPKTAVALKNKSQLPSQQKTEQQFGIPSPIPRNLEPKKEYIEKLKQEAKTKIAKQKPLQEENLSPAKKTEIPKEESAEKVLPPIKKPVKKIQSDTRLTKKEFIKEVSELSNKSVHKPEKKTAKKKIPKEKEEEKISIIHLKNGFQLEGKIIQDFENYIELSNEGASVKVNKNEIEGIEHITKEEFNRRIKKSREIEDKKFLPGQEVVVITYDDKVIQGTIISIKKDQINLLLDAGNYIVKKNNIKFIEKK